MQRVILCMLFACALSFTVHSQDTIRILQSRVTSGLNDSAWIQRAHHFLAAWKKIPQRHKEFILQKEEIELPDLAGGRKKNQPFINITGGSIQYNLNYRSRIDTPFAENDILQHLLYINAQVTVAGNLPFRIMYTGRQSNSGLFRDFNDVQIDFDTDQFRKLQAEKLQKHIAEKINQFNNRDYWDELVLQQFSIDQYKQLLSKAEFENLLIESRKNLLVLQQPGYSSPWKDSIAWYSRHIITLYDSLGGAIRNQQSELDSLSKKAIAYKKKLSSLSQRLGQPLYNREALAQLTAELKSAGLADERVTRLAKIFSSIRTLSIGRTLPDYSSLSVQNINVKGVNFEYNNDRFYAAFTAGAIDFRSRDFLYGNRKNPPQFVYAARIGLGQKNGTHFIVTGFRGKKQLYFSPDSKSSELFGVTAALQYVKANYRIAAEVAQSSSLQQEGIPAYSKAAFSIRDNSSRAWNISGNAAFPRMRTTIEGMYQHTGLNFQSFNPYRINSNANAWAFKAEQYIWKRYLKLTASIRKNDFSNPLIVQNYNSNTVFKTLQLSFRKKGWPSVSAGYIPSSQYAKVGEQVFESRYHTLNISANHFYRLGISKASTTAFYSKFYNEIPDSSFLYYNAHNISVFQQFLFDQMTLSCGMTITSSNEYDLYVSEGGIMFRVLSGLSIDGGVKISYLDKITTKVGGYASTRFSIKGIGDVQCWYENNYLPGLGSQLIRNEQMNIGFTRYFK